uniref:Uncharacterized protein n=1 Tax=Arundo donax TaxID=35708 RepID=A0A0A9CF23_ARUDO
MIPSRSSKVGSICKQCCSMPSITPIAELLFTGSISSEEPWGANEIPAFRYGEGCREILSSKSEVFCWLYTDSET